MPQLIITEKPSSAVKVAAALGGKAKPTRKKHKKGFYYEIDVGGETVYVASCVGHLYGLVEKGGKSWEYPVFDIEWKATYDQKGLEYTKDYLKTIEYLAGLVDEIIIASDYDVEGEVIGLNALRFACGRSDASRMKFSTLTKKDLVESYAHRGDHINWGQAIAGTTRHQLDWFYGINLSRALMKAVQAAGSFKVLSTGRVQGPALKLLADKEKEIRAFVPVPFWEILLHGKTEDSSTKKKVDVEAKHVADKIFDANERDRILKVIDGQKQAAVSKVDANQRKQQPPTPFNLTDLQSESYKLFKITPKRTLEIAQKLYTSGWMSYPRTSSQQLDPKLGFSNILNDLAKQPQYKDLVAALLKENDGGKSLKPNNGKKTDPAHPAIYPTGQIPEWGKLHDREKKVYDLVVKRFMATFAKPATRETQTVILDVKGEEFVTKGTRTVDAQWHNYYNPYVRLEEVSLPAMKVGGIVDVDSFERLDKETQPPRRFNQSSIIKELEKRNLGTKATRADILDRLFKRGYITGVQIEVTELGIGTVELLERHAPMIVDEKLTTDIQEDLDRIESQDDKAASLKVEDKIIGSAKKDLTSLFTDFKKKEKEIGKEIIGFIKDARVAAANIRELGVDPKSGKKVIVRIGRYGPMVQIGASNVGEKGEDIEEKPRFASIPQDINMDDITLEEALKLFTMPRNMGAVTGLEGVEDGYEVKVNIGRFGPYVQYGTKKYASIPKEDDPFAIGIDRVKEIIAAKVKAEKEKFIQVFEKEGISVLKGRYGPYITDGSKNARIPTGKEPATLTLAECQEALSKVFAKGKKKKTAKKKAAVKKKKTTKSKTVKKKKAVKKK